MLLPVRSLVRLCLHLLWHGTEILHVHSTNLHYRALIPLCRLRGCTVDVTLHTAEEQEQFGAADLTLRRFVVAGLHRADALLLVGDGAQECLTGVLGDWPNTHLIRFWVAPLLEEALPEAPAEVRALAARGLPLLAANGALRLRSEGDLYGFGLILEALTLLLERGRALGLLLYSLATCIGASHARTTSALPSCSAASCCVPLSSKAMDSRRTRVWPWDGPWRLEQVRHASLECASIAAWMLPTWPCRSSWHWTSRTRWRRHRSSIRLTRSRHSATEFQVGDAP